MGRTATFGVVRDSKGRWRVNTPASVSESGRRIQKFFPTREKANEYAKSLKTNYREHGSQARTLSPGKAEDAAKAFELLAPLNVSLTTAARFYREHHDKRAKAPTLAEAWQQGRERRSGARERYQRDFRFWEGKLPSDFMAKNIVDLSPRDIEAALIQSSPGKTTRHTGLRIISAILGDQVKRGTLTDNPCRKVDLPKPRNAAQVSIYSVDQLKALFSACKVYSDGRDRDCSVCAVPFAFLAFAGIRPAELTRLRWEKVRMETGYIRLDGNETKTSKTRNVRINPTLKAWIETLPNEKRSGSIIPPHWKEKSARVKREAGLDSKKLQDALRHSYGSYKIAIEGDTKELREDFGHTTWTTFFSHYHNAVTEKEALPYWEVLPQSPQAI